MGISSTQQTDTSSQLGYRADDWAYYGADGDYLNNNTDIHAITQHEMADILEAKEIDMLYKDNPDPYILDKIAAWVEQDGIGLLNLNVDHRMDKYSDKNHHVLMTVSTNVLILVEYICTELIPNRGITCKTTLPSILRPISGISYIIAQFRRGKTSSPIFPA